MELQLSPNSFDWVLLKKNPFLIKFTVNDLGYYVVVTDLVQVYGELLKVDIVHQRFHDLNQFADVKSDKVLKNIKQGLQEFSANLGSHTLQHEDLLLIINLDFSSNLVSLKYQVRMQLLPQHKLTDFIIGPIINCAALCERKIKELQNVQIDKKSNMYGTPSDSSLLPEVSSNSSVIHESESKPAHEISDMLLNTFAKLQTFFNQLSLENVESVPSPRKENASSSNIRKYDGKKIISGPVTYEEGNNLSLRACVAQEPCDTNLKPVKRPKKKSLNI